MKNNLIKNIPLYIMVSTIIFPITLFILSAIDTNSCAGMFGALGSNCHSTTYLIFFFLSLPLMIFSIIGFYCKNSVLFLIGSIYFFIINLVLLFITSVEFVKLIEMFSILFSCMLIIIEILLLKKSR